jgi:glucuronate isomerase
MKPFLSEDFLLHTETAKVLYRDFAENMPIFDYHCHLPVKEIAENKKFENLTQIWLNGDHYKWRAMRANGIDERYITGEATDYEKFAAWAATVPQTLRNPLYHWTHLELKRYFGITDTLLNPDTCRQIFDTCSTLLQTDEFRTQGLLDRMNVKVVCTTDDPVDSLAYHQQIKEDQSFSIEVLPAFRPDQALAVETPEGFNHWVGRLETAADMEIKTFAQFLEGIQKRHDFFHQMGCRISDHGLEQPVAEPCSVQEIPEILKFKSAMLIELARMDAEKQWTQQFHLGALRNTNSRAMQILGPDTGYDSIGDFEMAKPLATFFDALEMDGKLAKTILYVVNPRDNEMIATMIGNYQDGSVPGKIQFGSAWWFCDQKDGMERQINTLSNMGLLSRFVGMLTDSRSFLSYPRHEYFRRVLCNLLGTDVENGELPYDITLLGNMVKDICWYNAVNYFGIELP